MVLVKCADEVPAGLTRYVSSSVSLLLEGERSRVFFKVLRQGQVRESDF